MAASIARARALRQEQTEAEGALWRLLRGRRFDGWKFRRQHPYAHFVLDFYCPRRRLAIELDGGGHYTADKIAYDARRTAFLRQSGNRGLALHER